MAATAFMGNAFDIYVTNDATANIVIANPVDFTNFKVIRVSVFNSSGTNNFRLTDGTNDICAAQATVSAAWKDMVINPTHSTILSADTLTIVTPTATMSQIILHCIGADADGDNEGMISYLSCVSKQLSVG